MGGGGKSSLCLPDSLSVLAPRATVSRGSSAACLPFFLPPVRSLARRINLVHKKLPSLGRASRAAVSGSLRLARLGLGSPGSPTRPDQRFPKRRPRRCTTRTSGVLRAAATTPILSAQFGSHARCALFDQARAVISSSIAAEDAAGLQTTKGD